MDRTGHQVRPLIGRHDALKSFERLLHAAAGGSFRFLRLVGEPGTGKTRLLDEVALSAVHQEFTVLHTRATEFEQGIPFGVVINALVDHLGRRGAPKGAADEPLELSAIFPTSATEAPGGPPSADVTGLARHQIFRDVSRLLGELAQPSGLLLILDDAHWADAASIELLDHLVRHPPLGPVLIAVAYRPGQATPRLNSLRAAGVHTLPVEPFTRAEAAEFLGGQDPDRFEALYEASGGIPFYLEALAAMDQSGSLPGACDFDGCPDALPPAVRAVIQLELDSLTPTARLVAQAGALLGDAFDPVLAGSAAGVTEEAALEALDDIAARDLVRAATSTGRFRFRHPLVRHTVYRSAAAGWQRLAHARIAARLGELGAPASMRAHHVARSGSFGDADAVATLVEAARSVLSHAPATAARWFIVARELTPVDPGEPGPHVDLLLEIAQAQLAGGQLAGAHEHAAEALRQLPPDDHGRRSRAAACHAAAERLGERPAESRPMLLTELRKIPDPWSAAATRLRLQLAAGSVMDDGAAATRAAPALDGAPQDGDDWDQGLRLEVAAHRVLPAYRGGRIAEAARHAERATRLFDLAGDEHCAAALEAAASLCLAEVMMGHGSRALRILERLLGVARHSGRISHLPRLLSVQSYAYTHVGKPADAWTAGAEAVRVARALGAPRAVAFAMATQCLAASWQGSTDEAMRLGRDAAQAAGDRPEWWAAFARYAHAIALLNAERRHDGRKAVLNAFDGFHQPVLDRSMLLHCCEAMAHAEAAHGRVAEATKWANRAGRMAHPDLPVDVALARLAHAHALCAAHPAAAAEHASAAAAAFTASEFRIGAGRARLRAGAAHARAADSPRALRELRAAADTFRSCGTTGLYQQALREQREIDAKATPSGKRNAGPWGLSRREQEVAMLLMENHTNRQIAEKLFLSVRTVETHLSHIFTKLGVTSRLAVVNALRDQGTARCH